MKANKLFNRSKLTFFGVQHLSLLEKRVPQVMVGCCNVCPHSCGTRLTALRPPSTSMINGPVPWVLRFCLWTGINEKNIGPPRKLGKIPKNQRTSEPANYGHLQKTDRHYNSQINRGCGKSWATAAKHGKTPSSK